MAQSGFGQHAGVERGHAHEYRGLCHQRDRPAWLKAVHPQHGAAVEQRAVDGDKQTVDMEDRQRMYQHVVRLPGPVLFEHLCIAEQVAVAEHRAFAAPGGTAGIQNGGQIAWCARSGLVHIAVLRSALQQAAGTVVIQGENILHAAGKGLLADGPETGRCADHHSRGRVVDEVIELGALVRRVQRQIHQPGAQGSQVHHHGLDGFFHLHGDP